MSDAPEKIWVQDPDGCGPVSFCNNQVNADDVGYTDTIPSAAYVAGLEAAASHLLLNYLQDEHDEPDLCVDDAHWSAIHDLHNALASRPAPPDVLVVGGYRGTTEQLCNALDEMIAREKRQMQASILQAARAIIGGQP